MARTRGSGGAVRRRRRGAGRTGPERLRPAGPRPAPRPAARRRAPGFEGRTPARREGRPRPAVPPTRRHTAPSPPPGPPADAAAGPAWTGSAEPRTARRTTPRPAPPPAGGSPSARTRRSARERPPIRGRTTVV